MISIRVFRRIAFFIPVLTALACGTARLHTPEDADFLIKASLDRSVYRPGQAMLMTVVVTNNTNKQQNVPELNAASLSFHFIHEGTNDTMGYPPVVSDFEDKEISENPRFKQIEPGETLKRQFMLTQFTSHMGNLRCQAHYDPTLPYDANHKKEKVYSNPVPYSVAGALLFDRDTDGLIRKKDAIRLAEAQVQGEVAGSQAVAITDEKGFARYWVNVALRENGGERVRSFFIDPYVGKVWAEAQPFQASMIKDRGANAPPAPPRPLGPGPARAK